MLKRVVGTISREVQSFFGKGGDRGKCDASNIYLCGSDDLTEILAFR